jgi:cytochrome c oxidase assembly protein subunit 11
MMFQTTIREKFSPRLLLCHTGNNNIIITSNPWFWRRQSLRRMVGDSTTTSSKSNANMALTAQNRSFEYYQRKKQRESWFWNRSSKKRQQRTMTAEERNIQVAWYMVAVVVGAIGATYASVPLYKVFCQATGFGGTTQRVIFEGTNGQPNTLEKAFRSLMQTVAPNLITVRFDSTINDRMPWSFVPVALDVKVVPGETALSFFRVTNHSDKAITGVATYNVHPPKVGLYFQKIQCFCFEEQRLLPGETVDMPVFFFIDPEMLDDPQVSYITDVTLSYTFFQTDEDDDQEDEEQK